jgi:uncharacterized protein
MIGTFEVRRYDFNSNVFSAFDSLHYVKDFWPLVYILSDENSKMAYVGETSGRSREKWV